MIRHAYSNPIEEEIARGIAGNVNHMNTEIGVRKIAQRPRTPPSVPRTAEDVGRRTSCQRCSAHGVCPCRTAIPRQLDTDLGRAISRIGFGVQPDFDAVNCRAGNRDVIVVEIVFVIAAVGATVVPAGTAVAVRGKGSIIDIGIRRTAFIAVTISA